MPNPHDVLGPTILDYEAWRDLLCSMCGRYYSESIEPNAFAGWVRPVTARGFTALDIGCNAHAPARARGAFPRSDVAGARPTHSLKIAWLNGKSKQDSHNR